MDLSLVPDRSSGQDCAGYLVSTSTAGLQDSDQPVVPSPRNQCMRSVIVPARSMRTCTWWGEHEREDWTSPSCPTGQVSNCAGHLVSTSTAGLRGL